MNMYLVYFADGSSDTIVIAFMATEKFRLQHGGKSDAGIVLAEVKTKYPGRRPVRIERALTGAVVWESPEQVQEQ